MGKLITASENQWTPEYEGVNYRNDYMRYVGEMTSIDQPPDYVYYQDQDGFIFQVTEESCMHYQNITNEDLESVAIIDPRDQRAWWWFRGIHNNFEDLVEVVGLHATVLSTIIPRPEVVRNFVNLMESKQHDEVPEEWLNGSQ